LATLRNRAVECETQAQGWSEVASLVRRAQAGDRTAFGRLVEQFERTVHAIGLRRLGNPSDAAELTQEVFLHVMRRIGQLREPERFAGWLRQVTVRMAINRATRRLAPACVGSIVLEGACADHEGPVLELIARERAGRLWEAIADLKPLDREALLAFYIQGESLLTIAARLEVPIGTVKRRLHTARKRLKAALLARAGDPGEWSETDDSVEPDDDDSSRAELVGAGAGDSALW
jgi:RNA polymerase sigma-70 factor (ECF subfamily)